MVYREDVFGKGFWVLLLTKCLIDAAGGNLRVKNKVYEKKSRKKNEKQLQQAWWKEREMADNI